MFEAKELTEACKGHTVEQQMEEVLVTGEALSTLMRAQQITAGWREAPEHAREERIRTPRQWIVRETTQHGWSPPRNTPRGPYRNVHRTNCPAHALAFCRGKYRLEDLHIGPGDHCLHRFRKLVDR